MKTRPLPSLIKTILLLMLLALPLTACGPRPAVLSDPTAPPTEYLRRIIVLVETSDFYPIAGAEITVALKDSTTRLISPASGSGRTNGQGALELVFEPFPHYDKKVMAGGDILADFPVQATLSISRSGRPSFKVELNDTQSFARFADPLYQGLDRDPLKEPSYFHITVP